MGKQHAHQQDLAALFVILLKRGDKVRLVEYLITHSNLPGPRGNLELAQAFAREAAVQAGSDRDTVWSLCLSLASISPAHAPTNSPMEFLGFCGATGLGAVAAASPPLADRALTELRRLADDSRWRMREAVAMALQELLRARPQRTLPRLKTWISAEHWLAMRAVAAGIAEPSLLEGNARMAATALLLHRRILQRVRAAKDRTAEPFRTLRQALGYSISVVTAATPQAGFAFLRDLAAVRDSDVQWIVRENLKKQRLARADPEQAAALARLVTPAASEGRPAPARGGRASRKG